MIFRLLGGSHRENDVTYDFSKERETLVPSDNELDKLFKNKFQRVGGDSFTTHAPLEGGGFGNQPTPVIRTHTPEQRLDPSIRTIDESVKSQPLAEAENPPPAPEGPLGREVTEGFPTAVGAGLRVFRRRGRLVVTIAGTPEETIQPGDGYVTQPQVEKFITKWTEQNLQKA